MQGKWVEDTDRRMAGREVAGDICLRRPRPIQGCRADDEGGGGSDDDDYDDEKHTLQKQTTNTSLFNTLNRDAKFPNTRSPGQLHFV
jgi:hypothetical protein